MWKRIFAHKLTTHTSIVPWIINITDAKQEVGIINGSEPDDFKRANNKATTPFFCIRLFQLSTTLRYFSSSNTTDYFSWKTIAAVVIHLPVCPGHSFEFHSSASTPPPQCMNQRTQKEIGQGCSSEPLVTFAHIL